MIPYVAVADISFGPLTLHVWGLLVALGLAAGLIAAGRIAQERRLEPKVIYDLAPAVIIGGLVGARLFHVLFYEPAFFFQNPAEIVAVWKGGLSITGGLAGAAAIGLWLLKRRRADALAYADAVAFGLPLGTFVGRIGCFLTHLHPGRPTSFFLGVLYPDGVIRHDLGLYLSLNGLVLFLVFMFLKKGRLPVGSFLVGYLLWYGTTRFLLDFLRATDGPAADARYLGLTPAQYVSIALLAVGLFGVFKIAARARKNNL